MAGQPSEIPAATDARAAGTARYSLTPTKEEPRNPRSDGVTTQVGALWVVRTEISCQESAALILSRFARERTETRDDRTKRSRAWIK
jgi:hypothetical protein